MKFACLYIPDFPVQAVVRGEPALRGRAVAVVEPDLPLARVLALNEASRRAGVERGMSRVEVAGLAGVEVRRRSIAAEASAHAALLDLARSFSPRFEDIAADMVVLDLAGLETLLGPAKEIARRLTERGQELGLEANVALAPNPDAARLAARGGAGITLIGKGEEAERLGDLPVGVLEPSEEMRETFDRWGIRTCRGLAALPPAELSERLGQEGIRLQTLARGGALRALVPAEEPLHFQEALDLEYPVAELEPLAFILGRLLSQLAARLATRGLAAQEMRLVLGLEEAEIRKSKLETRNSKVENRNSETRTASLDSLSRAPLRVSNFDFRVSASRTLRLPVPVRDSRLLLKLWRLDLEAHPPAAPVRQVTITAEPAPLRVAQGDLFLPLAPDPQKLELTLARLRRVVGEGQAGSPELLDTHRPDAFRMRRFADAKFETRNSKPETRGRKIRTTPGDEHLRVSNFDFRISNTALRLFRPPLAASVQVRAGRPVRVDSQRVQGRVVSAAGPWRTSGGWWTESSWESDEWDVEILVVGQRSVERVEGRKSKVERVHLYRIYCDLTNGRWFVAGLYD